MHRLTGRYIFVTPLDSKSKSDWYDTYATARASRWKFLQRSSFTFANSLPKTIQLGRSLYWSRLMDLTGTSGCSESIGFGQGFLQLRQCFRAY